MKKIWLCSPFIISMLASPLFGDQQNEIARGAIFGQSQKKQKNSQDKNCASCCTPEMNYRLPGEFHGVNTFAEYLIWQTQQQASHFVITPNANSSINLSYPNTQGLGDFQSASFNWSSGFRVGLGYTFIRDSWAGLGQYTWYETSGQNGYSITVPISATTTQYLMPTSYAQSTSGISSASSSAHFSYQMGDLLASRRFLPTEQIQLNFSFGGTGGYIKENFNVVYGATNNTYMHNDWQFGGGGFRAGIDSNWHFGGGFGVFGKFSFAAILGQYTNTCRITADSPVGVGGGSGVSTRIVDSIYQGIMLMPATQIALGFDWCRSFDKCGVSAVRIAVAGEFNNLANLQQVFKSTKAPTNSLSDNTPMFRDLSSVYMYGANVRVGIDY